MKEPRNRYRCAVCGELVRVTGFATKEFSFQALQTCGDRVPWKKVSAAWRLFWGERVAQAERKAAPDVVVSNPGSNFVLFDALGDADLWLREHTNGTWIHDCLAVDLRYAEDLILALREQGFTVELEGF